MLARYKNNLPKIAMETLSAKGAAWVIALTYVSFIFGVWLYIASSITGTNVEVRKEIIKRSERHAELGFEYRAMR